MSGAGLTRGGGPAPIQWRLWFFGLPQPRCSNLSDMFGGGIGDDGGQLVANLGNDAVNSGRGGDDCFRGRASVAA